MANPGGGWGDGWEGPLVTWEKGPTLCYGQLPPSARLKAKCCPED